MENKKQNVIIIGGGIMGLFTAYYASMLGKKITILEKRTIGNKEASSFSFTRSIRNDYLDPFYAQLAYEAQGLWRDLQRASTEKFIFDCGCLNIAKKTVTEQLETTYAAKSYKNLTSLNFKTKKFNKETLQQAFPQFAADIATLDTQAGFLFLPIITTLLVRLLKQNNVTIIENVDIQSIEESSRNVCISTNTTTYLTEKLVITAGIWENDILRNIKNCTTILPISKDRPQECKYIYPQEKDRSLFMPDTFPVFAYLDVGIYGHPIFDKRGAIKIGYYNPPDVTRKENTKIQNINDFIRECLPLLKNAREEEVMDADQCSYDLVSDDNFILGKLQNFQHIFIGTGWRGTGYKFAPLIGKILMQLSLQGNTIYDINRFTPNRFSNNYESKK
ncbi:MAG TPA: FAD-dependent oxidoreductase [Candidatus Saccharimonadales bacterium]|nr:FAD-dependent oxidoreductase [Candidatus Saccharimonadales bacterium]